MPDKYESESLKELHKIGRQIYKEIQEKGFDRWLQEERLNVISPALQRMGLKYEVKKENGKKEYRIVEA